MRKRKNVEIKEKEQKTHVETSDVEDVDKDYIAVGDVMVRDIIWAKPDDTIESVAKKMYKNRIEGVFIFDKGKNREKLSSGVITSKDIVYKVVAKGKDPKKVKAKEIATHGLITISPEATLAEAATKMKNNDIRRLAVENSKGMIVGVITESDIARISPQIMKWIMETRAAYKDFIPEEEVE